jgi:2-methylcitrate dehydratase
MRWWWPRPTMDETLGKLTDYTIQLNYGQLTSQAVHECKRRLVDTLACVFAGFNAPPSRIARTVAARASGKRPARILGTLEESSPEQAAFANGVMMRCMDFNDATGSGGGHPSDMFAALLAAAETERADGKTFIAATVLAYELYLGFFAGNRIRNRGWDHVVYTALAAAAGIALIKRLDRERTANALSLALTPNMALEVARRGELSMWKGCAGGNAARNAVFAAELAAEGLTGPQQVFEGDHGVWNAVGEFAWPPLPGPDGPFRIADTQIKLHPFVYQGQAPVETALSIRTQVGDPSDIEEIVVNTYWYAWSETGSEPEKWAPTTRETADHSIPYLVCVALVDGRFDANTFAPERIADPGLRALMQKVRVHHDTDLDRFQPANSPCRIEVRLKSGRVVAGSVDNPKGHKCNPATDRDLVEKFMNYGGGLLQPNRMSDLLDLCWRLEEIADIGKLVAATKI